MSPTNTATMLAALVAASCFASCICRGVIIPDLSYSFQALMMEVMESFMMRRDWRAQK
jgi:hypothetical protein